MEGTMGKILAALPAPALAGVVREKNKASAIAEIKNCLYDGADMIDLHLSCLEHMSDEELKSVITSTRLPILALNYNTTYDWKSADYTEEARVASLLRAIDLGASGIDMQGYTYDLPSKSAFCGDDRYSFTRNHPKEVVTDDQIIQKQCELIEMVHHKGGEVLLSCHPGVTMDTRQVVDLALFLEQRKPDIIKLVTTAANEEDLLESFKAMSVLKKEVRTPVSYHANGAAGSLSRIINPILGGQIIFCVDHYKENSTMEQLDLRTVRQIIDQMQKIR